MFTDSQISQLIGADKDPFVFTLPSDFVDNPDSFATTGNPELDELIEQLCDNGDLSPKFSVSLAGRKDFSPALVNFLRDIFKPLPDKGDFIPDELTSDDKALLELIPRRSWQSIASRDTYKDILRRYVDNSTKGSKSKNSNV